MQSMLIHWDDNHASSMEQLLKVIMRDWPVVYMENDKQIYFTEHYYHCSDCSIRSHKEIQDDYRGKHRTA